MRIQPSFTNVALNRNATQNQPKNYASNTNFGIRGYVRSQNVVEHSEVLKKGVRELLSEVIRRAKENKENFDADLFKFVEEKAAKFGVKISFELKRPFIGFGDKPLKYKGLEEVFTFNPTAELNGEKVVLHKESGENNDCYLNLSKNKTMILSLSIKNNKVIASDKIEGYKFGDLNKTLNTWLTAILENQKK